MIRSALAATTLLLAAVPVPAAAQSPQEALQARYDRALAAGYKALMMCGAIANAEANGTTRTPESVETWELSGIQAPQAAIIGSLPHEIVRHPSGQVAEVRVRWAEDMLPRIATFTPGQGCHAEPIGAGNAAAKSALPEFSADRAAAFLEDNRALAPVDAAFASDTYGAGARTTAVLVVRKRMIEAERYAPGFAQNTPQRTWSVAKSIAATLVGAAVQRGEADVNASAGLGLSDTDPRRAITIDHLLRMASGRYSDSPGNRTDPLYWGGASVDEVALDWPLVTAPGTSYRYANNDTLAAIAAIRSTFAAHPPAQFFATLGMNHTVAETDWRGDYILFSQVWTTARDLARFGQLYLDDGMWNGRRLLPEGWARYVANPSGPQPPTGTFGYGAGFWLLNREEGVPTDTFAAIGNRGQYVVIVPSRKVVIVRRGEDPVGSGFDIAAFTRDVLAALPAE